jgi:hypothetical protein
MKILVYNSYNQYALSRNQIEIIQTILPKEYFMPIREFHIMQKTQGQERFEYNYDSKIAYFGYPVKQKSSETFEDAVRVVLVGLQRIKAKVKFGHYIPKNEMAEYLPFVDNWLPKCLKALHLKKE